MGIFAVGSKEDTDLMYVGWHMKWSRHGTAVSQDNYNLQNRMKVLITQEGLIYAEEDTRKNELTYDEVDTRRNGMKDYINEKDTEMVTLKEDEQSHFKKLMENTNGLAMNRCGIYVCMPNLYWHVMEMNGGSGRFYTSSWKKEKRGSSQGQ